MENKKCPYCGAENKNLNLSESEGLYECCNCGKVVDTKADKEAAECCKKIKIKCRKHGRKTLMLR